MLGKDVDLHALPIPSIATAMAGDISVPALRSQRIPKPVSATKPSSA